MSSIMNKLVKPLKSGDTKLKGPVRWVASCNYCPDPGRQVAAFLFPFSAVCPDDNAAVEKGVPADAHEQ